jgi:orotate phosphoribosyltransferase
MRQDLLNLVAPRSGHFRLESGLHGDIWLDLDGLFSHPHALHPFVAELATRLAAHPIDVICGPQTGGAILAQMVAAELNVEFYFAERIAGPPVEYLIPTNVRSRIRDKRVAVVDDAIYAGSAVGGTIADLKLCGASIAAVAALLVLGDRAAKLTQAERLPLEHLVRLDAGLWAPAECPLCAAGEPLQHPTEPFVESSSLTHAPFP